MDIVYLGYDVLVFCRNVLRSYHGIRAHRARQGHKHLDVRRLAYRLYPLFGFVFLRLSRSHSVKDTQNEGRKFVSARNTVKGKTRFTTVSVADPYARCKIG